MIDCAIIGDSIALGVANLNRSCQSQAVSGITSREHIHRFSQPIHASRVLISLGSNDDPGQSSEAWLRQVRARVVTGRVAWLLSPNNERANSAARRIASERGDMIIEVRPWVGPDRVHPTPAGYSRLSAIWRGA